MKLIPTRPVTILSVRHGERWFPFLFRHTDGSLLLYVGHGHDRNFAPHHRLRSLDGGRTWIEEQENVPRPAWCHSFADGELFEIDAYGVQDPKDPQTCVHYGAWSFPSQPGHAVVRDRAPVHSPSSVPLHLPKMASNGYPTFPWWPLFNSLHGKDELSGNEVWIGGPVMTSGIEHEGKLLAVGHIVEKQNESSGLCSALCYESSDRGRHWEERGVIGRGVKGMPEGLDEASLVALKDGRLYCVMRSGKLLYHGWSSDGGKTWTQPEVLRLIDSDHVTQMAWPGCRVLDQGTP